MHKIAELSRLMSDSHGIELYEIDVGRSQSLRVRDPITGNVIMLNVIEAAELEAHIGHWLAGDTDGDDKTKGA